MGTIRPIRIHYHRPPDGLTIYRQLLVHDDGHAKVTLARGLDLPRPLRIGGTTVLEAGSDAVWFTFPGRWHDIGRFHRADGSFTGIYANLITPCVFEPGGEWHTTDLFLDLWIPAAEWTDAPASPSHPRLLDEPELETAEAAGHLDPTWGERARTEAAALRERAATGEWPPPIVGEWTRGRCLAAPESRPTTSPGPNRADPDPRSSAAARSAPPEGGR